MSDATMDWVFIAANAVVFPTWLLLILQPRNPWTATLVHAAFVPLILGALYITGMMIAIATSAMAEGAGFLTLDQVMALFDSRLVALNGWIHYLAFDGVDDARSRHRMCQRVIVEKRITMRGSSTCRLAPSVLISPRTSFRSMALTIRARL